MRFFHALTFAAIAGIACAGCNPKDFDSILDHAPVVAVGTSGSSTGAVFALPLPLPVAGVAAASARMLLSRTDNGYLAVVDYDMNGKATAHRANSGDLGGSSVHSAAQRADGTILIGVPGLGGGSPAGGGASILSMLSSPDGSMALVVQNVLQAGASNTQGVSHLGIAVASGHITEPPLAPTGLATVGDFVVVGDTSVHLLSGVEPRATVSIDAAICPNLALAKATPYTYRSVAVGNLLSQSGIADEIVLGGQVNDAGPGMVVFLTYDATPPIPSLKCTAKLPLLPPVGTLTPANFGTSLAVGNFDGDASNFMDLAVGVPPDRVYVYFGPLDSVTSPSVIIQTTPGTSFGQRVAAYAATEGGKAQLLVADPVASVGDRAGAGKVYLFDIPLVLATLTLPAGALPSLTPASAVASFFDSNLDDTAGSFGLSLGGMQFDKSLCTAGDTKQLVPWASSGPKLLTFFNYDPAPPEGDPRCFAKK